MEELPESLSVSEWDQDPSLHKLCSQVTPEGLILPPTDKCTWVSNKKWVLAVQHPFYAQPFQEA
jgi:hypothetical protein